ncbi:MAG TPA: orotidine-5'-phosphate decarboxylase [Burkholderiales bacterium]|nr:orotidine-5'-phosphate decarboxylase [Burkholderiales bacterium]
MNEPRIIVALDYADARSALQFVDTVEPQYCRLKIGQELFTSAGPALVEQLARRGFGVFLDLKYHDIPHTVAQACKAASRLGAWMLSLHALGGRSMLAAAREAVGGVMPRPLVIAVTVPTSMGSEELGELGIRGEVATAVMRLARLAHQAGMDGVVCSGQEARQLKKQFGRDFCVVTPAIRPAQAVHDDQLRVVTPRQAALNGADYLVIGRPVTRAADPLQALQEINREMTGSQE